MRCLPLPLSSTLNNIGGTVAEFKKLNYFLDCMESTGSNRNLVRLSINQALVEEINIKNKTNYSLSDLQKATDKCLAHEWLEHKALGEKYTYLGITSKGVGAARSKQASESLKASRTLFKKVSDSIEEHKGLFVLLGIILALATFAAKLFEK